MEILTKLPEGNYGKTISREALAICIEAVYFMHPAAQKANLAQLIRQDETFDAVTVSESRVDIMQVNFVKFDKNAPPQNIPLFNTYCGNAVQKAVEKLPYSVRGDFPSVIDIKPAEAREYATKN